ncbi:MAG: hypothetical protein AB1898_18085 [Acidobacteriota bacterium]
MAARLTDQQITARITENKPLPEDYLARIQTKPKRGHKERELDLRGQKGGEFRLVLRQSLVNSLDFSVILAYQIPKTNQIFRLRRYNGRSHEHTNRLEGQTFYDFHIHTATERYQEAGMREDSFAEPTDRFADFQGALDCMLKDCGFVVPQDSQMRIFPEVD